MVVHALVVFLVPIFASKFAGGGTIGSIAGGRASGSYGTCIGSIFVAYNC